MHTVSITGGSDKLDLNRLAVVQCGFSVGDQECAHEFCTMYLDKCVEDGYLANVQWGLRTTTHCALLPRGSRARDCKENMLCLDKYLPGLGASLSEMWTRKTKLNGENKFLVTLKGKELGRYDAEQTVKATEIPDVAIVALKWRIVGKLKEVKKPGPTYRYEDVSLDANKQIVLALERNDKEMVTALVDSLHDLASKKRREELKLNFSKEYVLEKNCSYFSVPLTINFGDQRKATTHDLQAVVVHSGLPGAGHYWTYIRFVNPQKMEQWYMVNDLTVKPVTWDEISETVEGGVTRGDDLVKGQPVAYLLSYVRTKRIANVISNCVRI